MNLSQPLSVITLSALALSFSLAGCASAPHPTSDDAQHEISKAKAAFIEKDASLAEWFDTAHGYAIFPKVGKGGFVVGGGGGHGYVFEQGKMVGTTKVTMLSVGAQIGGQSFREVIFFENQRNLQNFMDGNVEFGAQVSAVAAKAGASKNARYEKGVAIFTDTRGGLMAEATVGGQKFSYKPLNASMQR